MPRGIPCAWTLTSEESWDTGILEETIDQLSGAGGQFEIQARQLQQQIWGHLGTLIQCSTRCCFLFSLFVLVPPSATLLTPVAASVPTCTTSGPFATPGPSSADGEQPLSVVANL